MTTRTKIEWTEQTWNPTTGCTKVSPGCKHCYAEVMARRLQAMGARGYDNGFAVSILPERLTQPLRRKRPTVWFVNSMSDLFHEAISDAYLDAVFDTIRRTPQHTFQILTKRAPRLPAYFGQRAVPANVWLGVSVEDRAYGVPRIAELRQVAAPIRFLSVEPLLEDLGEIDLSGIQWVIVGGESGPNARRMDPVWVDSIKAQGSAMRWARPSSSSNGAVGVRTGDDAPRRPTDASTPGASGAQCRIQGCVRRKLPTGRRKRRAKRDTRDRPRLPRGYLWVCPRFSMLDSLITTIAPPNRGAARKHDPLLAAGAGGG
jgi:protein gp37